ncbi:MAG: putative ATPase, partial [Chthonomonadales bacterium]|nr:putative ATPase [Chthonomonadales bacterium]
MLTEPWRIELLGGLQARQGAQVLSRFRTQKVGALLAYLALESTQLPLREQVAGILWPESDREAGRASLRNALASLRQQLEPHGTPANSVLLADRVRVGLNPEAISTDVSDFEAAVRRSLQSNSPEEAFQADLSAVDLYPGELLSGWYEEWIFPERERLGLLYEGALQRIVAAFERANDLDRAIEYAHRRITLDRTNEEAHLQLMRLFETAGRPEAALHQFRDLERILREDLGLAPSPGVYACVQRFQVTELAPAKTVMTPAPTLSKQARVSDVAVFPTSPSPQHPSSLPLPLTRFFGRETEIDQLLQLLTPTSPASDTRQNREARLVTLTGPGGSGKTRLSIEVANRLLSVYGGAVTFVPLADLVSADRIPGAIAEALRLPLVVPDDPLQPLVEALAGSPHLLVLDNFEQLLNCSPAETQTEGSDSALLVHVLLTRLPKLAILVTSRQRLDVEGEREYYVPTLPTPEKPGTPPERLLEFASVQLFVDRAQGVRADFQLKAQNVEAVGALCKKLEGIPLALELAAAWSHLLSPAQMLTRLEHRFELLVSKRKGVASRHQTLRAAIDWSYRLLSPELQRCFARLSVFAGSWTLEAAEAICEDPEVFEKLTQLAERSFLISEEFTLGECTQMRYRLLETLREFVTGQISAEERRELRRQHLAWYAQWAAAIQRHSMGTEQVFWLQRAEWELENIRAALHWSLSEDAQCLLGLELLGHLNHFWCLRGNYAEVHSLADRFLAHPSAQEPTYLRALSLTLAGTIAVYQKEWKAAERYYTQCLQVGQQSGDRSIVASTLMSLGGVATDQGEIEAARDYFQQSLRYYEALGHPLGMAAAQGAFGQLEMSRQDYPSALPYVLRAVELQRQERNLSGVTHHLHQ